jgi:hypothetical protein
MLQRPARLRIAEADQITSVGRDSCVDVMVAAYPLGFSVTCYNTCVVCSSQGPSNAFVHLAYQLITNCLLTIVKPLTC